MKKFIALLTALVMVLSFAGCGKDKNVRGTVSDNSGINDVLADPGEDGDGAEFSLGEVDGLTYENSFIGLGCTLDSGWTFYSDEQIRQINNAATDVAGEDYAKLMEQADLVYDMYATDQLGMSNINVNLEKVPALQLAAMNVADTLESQLPMLESTLENMGCDNVNCTITKVTVAGKEYDAAKITASIGEINMYEIVFAKKCSGYLANITICTFGENQTEEILGQFYNV